MPQAALAVAPRGRAAALRAVVLRAARPTSRAACIRVAAAADAAGSSAITSAVAPISDTDALVALQVHAKKPMPHLKALLADEKRCESMFVAHDNMLLDYSRQARGGAPYSYSLSGQGIMQGGRLVSALKWISE